MYVCPTLEGLVCGTLYQCSARNKWEGRETSMWLQPMLNAGVLNHVSSSVSCFLHAGLGCNFLSTFLFQMPAGAATLHTRLGKGARLKLTLGSVALTAWLS